MRSIGLSCILLFFLIACEEESTSSNHKETHATNHFIEMEMDRIGFEIQDSLNEGKISFLRDLIDFDRLMNLSFSKSKFPRFERHYMLESIKVHTNSNPKQWFDPFLSVYDTSDVVYIGANWEENFGTLKYRVMTDYGVRYDFLQVGKDQQGVYVQDIFIMSLGCHFSDFVATDLMALAPSLEDGVKNKAIADSMRYYTETQMHDKLYALFKKVYKDSSSQLIDWLSVKFAQFDSATHAVERQSFYEKYRENDSLSLYFIDDFIRDRKFDEFENAMAYLKNQTNNDPFLSVYSAQWFLANNKYKEALKNLNELDDFNVNHHQIISLYAEAYAGLGRHKEALEELKKLVNYYNYTPMQASINLSKNHPDFYYSEELQEYLSDQF